MKPAVVNAARRAARLLRLQPQLEKRLVRAMVAILDVFHFDISQEEPEAAPAPATETTGEAKAVIWGTTVNVEDVMDDFCRFLRTYAPRRDAGIHERSLTLGGRP